MKPEQVNFTCNDCNTLITVDKGTDLTDRKCKVCTCDFWVTNCEHCGMEVASREGLTICEYDRTHEPATV